MGGNLCCWLGMKCDEFMNLSVWACLCIQRTCPRHGIHRRTFTCACNLTQIKCIHFSAFLSTTCASSAFEKPNKVERLVCREEKRFNLSFGASEYSTDICTGNKCCDYAWRKVCVCMCGTVSLCIHKYYVDTDTRHVWVTALEAEPVLPPCSY